MDIHECSICLTTNICQNNKCITQCNHSFCKQCLDKWFDKGKNTCPMCRSQLQYFTHDGSYTRVISIDRPLTAPTTHHNRNVSVTQGFYNALFISLTGSIMVNGLMISLYVLHCDIDA